MGFQSCRARTSELATPNLQSTDLLFIMQISTGNQLLDNSTNHRGRGAGADSLPAAVAPDPRRLGLVARPLALEEGRVGLS